MFILGNVCLSPRGGGCTYLGWGGYLLWAGVPTLDRGYLLGWGYLSWTVGVPSLDGGVPTMDGGNYLGWGYLPWTGVPTLDRGTYPGWGTQLLGWMGVPSCQPKWGVHPSGWIWVLSSPRLDGVLPCPEMGYPSPGNKAAQRVLATRRAVCYK